MRRTIPASAGTNGGRHAIHGHGGAARLISAAHSRLGEVKDRFDARGTATLEVNPTDSLSLSYEQLDEDSATARDWFLLVGPPGSELGTPARAGPGGVGEGAGCDRKRIPTAFALRQNRPNPFSGRTTIHFELPVETPVRLEVFDAQGRLVRTLAEATFPAGVHGVEWDHRSDAGWVLGAGIYLYRINAGAFQDQRKMVLLAR